MTGVAEFSWIFKRNDDLNPKYVIHCVVRCNRSDPWGTCPAALCNRIFLNHIWTIIFCTLGILSKKSRWYYDFNSTVCTLQLISSIHCDYQPTIVWVHALSNAFPLLKILALASLIWKKVEVSNSEWLNESWWTRFRYPSILYRSSIDILSRSYHR